MNAFSKLPGFLPLSTGCLRRRHRQTQPPARRREIRARLLGHRRSPARACDLRCWQGAPTGGWRRRKGPESLLGRRLTVAINDSFIWENATASRSAGAAGPQSCLTDMSVQLGPEALSHTREAPPRPRRPLPHNLQTLSACLCFGRLAQVRCEKAYAEQDSGSAQAQQEPNFGLTKERQQGVEVRARPALCLVRYQLDRYQCDCAVAGRRRCAASRCVPSRITGLHKPSWSSTWPRGDSELK